VAPARAARDRLGSGGGAAPEQGNQSKEPVGEGEGNVS